LTVDGCLPALQRISKRDLVAGGALLGALLVGVRIR
jgi:hypothetical protein